MLASVTLCHGIALLWREQMEDLVRRDTLPIGCCFCYVPAAPFLFATCRDGRVRTTRGRCRIDHAVEFEVVKFVKVAKVVKVVNLVFALAGTPEHRRAEGKWSGGRQLRGAGGFEKFGRMR